jgi:hypothetical protein
MNSAQNVPSGGFDTVILVPQCLLRNEGPSSGELAHKKKTKRVGYTE